MKLKYYIVILLYFFMSIGLNACGVGTGCPAEKAETAKFDKRGNLKGGGGITRLLPRTNKR